jgi:hypothetical protein
MGQRREWMDWQRWVDVEKHRWMCQQRRWKGEEKRVTAEESAGGSAEETEEDQLDPHRAEETGVHPPSPHQYVEEKGVRDEQLEMVCGRTRCCCHRNRGRQGKACDNWS